VNWVTVAPKFLERGVSAAFRGLAMAESRIRMHKRTWPLHHFGIAWAMTIEVRDKLPCAFEDLVFQAHGVDENEETVVAACRSSSSVAGVRP
jgi:hypothetical protein